MVALAISAFMVISTKERAETEPVNGTTTTTSTTTIATTTTTTTTSTTTDQVVYQGSLRFTSDSFTNTLLDKDSLDYKEKEDKYGDMVSVVLFILY